MPHQGNNAHTGQTWPISPPWEDRMLSTRRGKRFGHSGLSDYGHEAAHRYQLAGLSEDMFLATVTQLNTYYYSFRATPLPA
jgi:hypothetical protein